MTTSDLPPHWPPALREVFSELRARRWNNMAEVQQFLGRRMAAYNAAPQAALGGLSPRQLALLLYGDWETHGALRVNAGLSPQELRR